MSVWASVSGDEPPMNHDPLCPAPLCDYTGKPGAECMGYEDCWHDCQCGLVARVREDERRKTLKAASEALDVLDRWGEDTYKHIVIDYDEAVAAIESLGDEDD